LRSEKEKKQMDVEQRVKKVVAKHLKTDEDKIKLESDFVKDLGAESIQSIELVAAFEEEFDMEISDEEAQKMRTVSDVIGYLKDKVSE
jgi:acyl carrier protein